MAKRGRKPGQPLTLFERRILRRVMLRLGWTNRHTAERSGVSDRVISFARNGRRIDNESHHAIMAAVWDAVRADPTLMHEDPSDPEADPFTRVEAALLGVGLCTEEARAAARIGFEMAA